MSTDPGHAARPPVSPAGPASLPPGTALPAGWRTAAIGLGANLGEALPTLDAARQAIAAWPHSRLRACSAPYRSAPVDAAGPDFVNAVLLLDTPLAPLDLLDALQALELAHGRERPYHHAPRTLDLDLLCLGELVLDTPRLQLPHPRLHQRAFVLQPLLALWPGLHLPGLGALAPHLHRVQARQDQQVQALPGWPDQAPTIKP